MTEKSDPVVERFDNSENIATCIVHYEEPDPKKPVSDSALNLIDYHGVIGVGGGGTVYSGTRVSDGRQVALKFMRKDVVSRWGVLYGKHVPIEFLYLHKLSLGSSGVILMLGWFREDDAYALVMEFIPHAIDLLKFLDEQGPFPEDTCRDIFHQVAETILHCHKNGIVHRDIKPQNVLINPDTHEVKVIDFGCATSLKDVPELLLAGTPIYYPPEWYTEESYYGDRLDVWCLGVLLYTLVEGQLPFQDEDEIVKCKVHHIRGETFLKSYRNLVKLLLRKDQHKRPSVEDILAHQWVNEDSEESETNRKNFLTAAFRKFFKR